MNNKSENTVFNPIKESINGQNIIDTIWTTKILQKAIRGLEQGKKLKSNPFYENNIKLLKGDLVFKRTPEEIEEWKKCRNDIIYFSNTYCKLLTPEGIQTVKMRDYQEEYLKHLIENPLSILLSCRQSGKCLMFITKIEVLIDRDNIYLDCLNKKSIKKIKNKFNLKYKKYNTNNQHIYYLPMFELFNLYENNLLWKIKYFLYKILYKIWKY